MNFLKSWGCYDFIDNFVYIQGINCMRAKISTFHHLSKKSCTSLWLSLAVRMFKSQSGFRGKIGPLHHLLFYLSQLDDNFTAVQWTRQLVMGEKRRQLPVYFNKQVSILTLFKLSIDHAKQLRTFRLFFQRIMTFICRLAVNPLWNLIKLNSNVLI